MRFNLLDLHYSDEDLNLRQCLRAYSIIPKYCEKPEQKNFEALKINFQLKKINKKLRKEIGVNWIEKWAKLIPYKLSKNTIKDWILGRVSIPLIAITVLKEFNCEKEIEEIKKNLKYISSTTRGVIRLPDKMHSDVFYLAGLLLGDGCFPIIKRKGENNFDYKVSYFCGSKDFIFRTITPLIKEMFEIKEIHPIFYHQAWQLTIRNKAVFRFFTRIIGLPSGKKSIKAHIPDTIKNLKPNDSVPFFAGLIDSDIGKHGNSIGCTFRSEKLVNDLVELLNKLGIKSKNHGTYLINNKYPQTDFKIKKSEIKRLKYVLDRNYLPKNPERIRAINMLLQECPRGQRSYP
ncbi:hypothetical protein KKG83_04165 [Candidatus Micrarchaeota archaeon]|nr:hypothetical protein [Candidatus Micrarchaeota archaeon]